MKIVVQKFGGTSVGDIERIKNVAAIIIQEKNLGNFPVVVVSAMAGTTNLLVDLAKNFMSHTNSPEYDSLLAAGEQISASLVAMCLNALGIKARSWLGWQLPITSDNNHSKARVLNVNVKAIMESVENDVIPIVAGFQSITDNNRISTLGRGGSDTSAAAISAAINAFRCDIYTDVSGIYTADPRIVGEAKRLNQISYQEMLELSSLGAKVLHERSVEIAMKYKIPLRVLSTFEPDSGTMLITDIKPIEDRFITAVTYSTDECKIEVKNIQEDIEMVDLCDTIAQSSIKMDMMTQYNSESLNIVFTIKKNDLALVLLTLKNYNINYTSEVAKISLVGVGVKSNTNVIKDVFEILSEKKIKVLLMSSSETRITVLIPKDYTELCIRALHAKFELDK